MPSVIYTDFNCYSFLGISSSASPREIRSAYLNKSRLHHPDMGGSHEQQVKVNLAYEILSDPLLREQHDRYWLYRSPDSSGFRKTPDKGKENKTSLNQNLHAKVALIFENEISHLYQEKQLWITNRTGVYFLKLKNWRKEELHAHTKLYEEYIKKLKKQKKERADSHWYAIIGAETFIVLLALSLFINLLGFDIFMISLLSMSIAFVFTTTGIASFSNLKWLIIDDKKLDITNPSIKNNIKQAIRKKLLSQYFDFANCRFEYNQKENWDGIVKLQVQNEWNEMFLAQKTSLNSRKENYLRFASEITELIAASVTYETSEEKMARRIAASLFLMGYTPSEYISHLRILIFKDDDESIVVRFRHRIGAPTNIRYVKDMVKIMQLHRSRRGFLFCTPGLSENAEVYAQENQIKDYSLEEMNEWIRNVYKSDYAGPSTDVLRKLETMVSFLRQMTLKLPGKQ